MIISPVFPDAIGIVENTEIFLDKEKLMSTIKWKSDPSGQGFFEQSQTNLQEYDEWKPLANWIQKKAREFWLSLGWNCNELWIPQFWMNSMTSGGNISAHRHSNSMISGVYYFKTTEYSGGTMFESTKNPLECMIQTTLSHTTEFNMGKFLVPAKEDHLVLFPSYMMHYSETNKQPTDRYSLAVNLLPTTLGKENHFNLINF